MPNIKSAKKRVFTNEKKNLQNRMVRSEMNSAVKKFNNAIETNNITEAENLLPLTISIIDSTASKGVIHKNAAANKKSALSKKLNDVKTGKIVIDIKKDNKTIAAEKAKVAQEARDAIKAENAKKAAEKAQLKLEAEKAKLEAEKAKLEAEKAAKKKAPKKVEKAEDVKEEKKPAAKKPAAKKETAKSNETPKAE